MAFFEAVSFHEGRSSSRPGDAAGGDPCANAEIGRSAAIAGNTPNAESNARRLLLKNEVCDFIVSRLRSGVIGRRFVDKARYRCS
jgi:hypothetical protein